MIRLFDFDGVLGSAFEEALFTMPVDPSWDGYFMQKASRKFKLHALEESVESRRYMLLQRAMWERKDGIRPGPLLDEASTGEFMILTARSDLYAIKRMHDFLDFHGLKPTRVFTLGSTPKELVVKMLLEEFPREDFTFWDDNPKHVAGVIALNNPRVTAIKVDNNMKELYGKVIQYYQKQIMKDFE